MMNINSILVGISSAIFLLYIIPSYVGWYIEKFHKSANFITLYFAHKRLINRSIIYAIINVILVIIKFIYDGMFV